MAIKRLQFDFTDEAVERLDELRQRCGASSRAEVVRRALMLLEFITNCEASGEKVSIRTAKGAEYRPLLF
jgi:metal-responsive CopG/Arc/MetJ family transcriptional regulator